MPRRKPQSPPVPDPPKKTALVALVESTVDKFEMRDWVKIGLLFGGVTSVWIGHFQTASKVDDSVKHTDTILTTQKFQMDSLQHLEWKRRRIADSLHDAKQDSLSALRDSIRNRKEDSILMLQKRILHIK